MSRSPIPERPGAARPIRGRAPTPAALAAVLCAGLAACAVGPDYVRPALDMPAAYKETGPWKTAEPRPAASGEPWWKAYGDTTLDGLMQDAERANQDLRVAEAQYRQARAAADLARAGLFPELGVSASATRARVDAPTVATGNAFSAALDASWEPDLWGGVRRAVEAGEATAQASDYDLAGAHLSIQTSLAQDYFQLRMTDRLRDLYAATTAAYTKALALTRAQYGAGVALRSDVALAESQLTTAQAQAVDLDASRAQLEHAIAILTGRAPSQFSLPAPDPQHSFDVALPATPAGMPSELLEHRPDIAAAERRAAAANAQIGVARAAYFPSLTLTASGGGASAALGTLFDAPSRVWSIGAALAETIFDGGARGARDAEAVAAWDAAAATYKQTVLSGFQQVEDDLATLRILDQEAQYQEQAVRASQLAESLALTQYRAGTASYLGVVTAQALSLTNQRAAVQLRGRQLAASVGLIAATGGGWTAASGAAPLASSAAAAAASTSGSSS
jgi:NodT family efflux transporter outer membrane factor (OMF) lipoprotein